jgi:DtxR family Mn-dependent transcriptional regulator
MHGKNSKQLSDHQEMYLKVIFNLIKEHKVARVKDIAEDLGVTKSSVSGALKALSEKGLIEYEPYGYATLTERGEQIAEQLVGKYQVLADFLVNVLAVPEDVADENACRMEHVVDNFVMERLVQFLRFFENGNMSFTPKPVRKKASAKTKTKVSD